MNYTIKKPLMIDLFCGLGGWTSGGLAEGYEVVGFDIERHRYPKYVMPDACAQKLPIGNATSSLWSERPIQRLGDATKGLEIAGWQEYPAQLVLQDILTIHGKQFKDATLIVASPPCQEFSYMAMPWSRAKQIQRALKGEDDFHEGYKGSRTVAELTALFDACFRIQREAIEAAGHFIPMVVENVRGAEKWVGRAKWHYGSFYLWGDVPALMPPAKSIQTASVEGTKGVLHRTTGHPVENGVKGFTPGNIPLGQNEMGKHWSNSSGRKAASAQIAKIPEPLARWIAKVYFPKEMTNVG